MKIRSIITFLALSFVLGSLAFSLSSCDNEREIPVDLEETHTVTTEAFILQPDGTLISFDTESLRAAGGRSETDRGIIEGGGEFKHNDKTTIKATAKGRFQLYTLFEKTDFSGWTKEAGKQGIVNKVEKSINVTVTRDLSFVAVFVGVDNSNLNYRDLKVNGVNGDYTVPTKAEATENGVLDGTLTTVGIEEMGVTTKTGEFTGWKVTKDNYGDWEVKDISEPWLTVTPSSGSVKYTATPFESKTEGPRTVTFKVGKDGKGVGKGVWRTVTITQNSYFENKDMSKPDGFDFGEGSGKVANIPPTLSHNFAAVGGQIDVKTLHETLKQPVYAVYKRYVNGKEIAPKREPVTVEFGVATPDWVQNSDSNYAAEENPTGATRNATANITWKVNGKVVKTTVVTFTQDVQKHTVVVEQ